MAHPEHANQEGLLGLLDFAVFLLVAGDARGDLKHLTRTLHI